MVYYPPKPRTMFRVSGGTMWVQSLRGISYVKYTDDSSQALKVDQEHSQIWEQLIETLSNIGVDSVPVSEGSTFTENATMLGY